MNNREKIPSDNLWREATAGETLYRWLLKGAGSKMPGVFFVFKRVSNPFKNRREASHRLTLPDGYRIYQCEMQTRYHGEGNKSCFETKNYHRNNAINNLPHVLLHRECKRVVPFFPGSWYHFFSTRKIMQLLINEHQKLHSLFNNNCFPIYWMIPN